MKTCGFCIHRSKCRGMDGLTLCDLHIYDKPSEPDVGKILDVIFSLKDKEGNPEYTYHRICATCVNRFDCETSDNLCDHFRKDSSVLTLEEAIATRDPIAALRANRLPR